MKPEAPKTGTVFQFGVYTIDLEKEELRKFDTAIRIAPQPFKLLSLLVSRPGEIVTREEIQQEIWGSSTHVDFEVGLNQCIRQIRAVLSDDAASPRYVETVPKKGYRFIAPIKAAAVASVPPVEQLPESETVVPTAKPAHSAIRYWAVAVILAVLVLAGGVLLVRQRTVNNSPQARKPSEHRMMIAVLPLENLTGDPQQEYLSDGLTDELTNHLSQFSPAFLGVIARTSSMRYKHAAKRVDEISKELGVDYILEGSVRKVADHLRINVNLVKARDQTQLWSDSYDGAANGEKLLAFQEHVSAEVAHSLSVVLPAADHRGASTSSPAAYDAYLRGRFEWNKRDEQGFRNAIGYFQQAIALDPNYSEPYAGLADCYNLLLEYFNQGSTVEMATKARKAAETAVKLDPQLAEGHASLAFNLWRYEWDYQDAEREFKTAIDVNPNYAAAHHWYGLFLASRARFNEARTQVAQAQALDPLSLIIMTNSGWVDYYARDYDSAIAKYRNVLAIDPSAISALLKSAWAFEQRQMWPDAEQARVKFFLAVGHQSVAKVMEQRYKAEGYPGLLKEMLRQAHEPDRKQYYGDYEIAQLSVMIGQTDQAIAALERAYSNRSPWMVYLNVEPDFDLIRKDARFEKLAREIEGDAGH